MKAELLMAKIKEAGFLLDILEAKPNKRIVGHLLVRAFYLITELKAEIKPNLEPQLFGFELYVGFDKKLKRLIKRQKKLLPKKDNGPAATDPSFNTKGSNHV